MKENFEIKNCFEFICPLKWDNLERSDNNVRYCGSCEKQVYKAENIRSFLKLSKQNKCVAFRESDNVPGIMGETIYPMFNKEIKLD